MPACAYIYISAIIDHHEPYISSSIDLSDACPQVMKLSTDPATELRGCFFPQQLQYFLTLLPLGKMAGTNHGNGLGNPWGKWCV